ncbi:MAG: hypothetical protein ACE15E_22320 [Acidobacteriota bacterium]
MKKWVALSVPVGFLVFGIAAERSWQRFYPDDPLWQEAQILIQKPVAVQRSENSDFLESSSGRKRVEKSSRRQTSIPWAACPIPPGSKTA